MEAIRTTWTEVKRHLAGGYQLKWIDIDTRYNVVAIDPPFSVSCSIVKTSEEGIEFETSFKAQVQLDNRVIISSQPDPRPFALPLYRTKRDAVENITTVDIGQFSVISFKLINERYVSGGSLIVENAEFGDYITAHVEDTDGIIPAPYRAGLCESYPIVSSYIEKEFVKVSSFSVSVHDIDTYPLNAKITTGLYLIIIYHSVNLGTQRRVVVNYNLSKKL